MDPALSSHNPTMPAEFGYCPRTPISNAVNASPQISIEVRKICCAQSSSSPSRSKSRFFDTLRLKSTRNAHVADENGSPKSLKKRQSIVNILPFSPTRSQNPPDSDHIYLSFRSKRSKATSPLKQKPVSHASSSRLNRRKSLGEIWGTISSRMSPRQGVVPLHSSTGNETQINDDEHNSGTGMSSSSVDSKQHKTPQKPSISSSLLWYEESTRISTPINRDESQTPNSYLNLLIASHNDLDKTSETKTRESHLQQPLEAHNVRVDRSAPDKPVSSLNLTQEQSPFWDNSTQVELSEDDEEFSLPPPYILDHFSDVEMGEIELRENCPFEHPGDSRNRAILPEIEVHEVGSLEESPNIDPEFYLRGDDRNRKYQKLMARPGLSQQSTDERIEKSIKSTVAKMIKNFHMVTSSEECLEGTSPAKDFDKYSFETDQVEVWHSILMGSRTLQQETPFQPLRSFPSKDRLHLCNHSEEQVLQDSIELRRHPACAIIDSVPNRGDLVPKTSNSLNSGQLQRLHSSSKRRRETSPTMIRVEFPKTVNLGAHAEIYESKSKAIAALYEYKLSDLSNFCTYDPSTHTIFAHSLESSVPNPAILKQEGLDVLWLPMQKDIAQLIEIKENKPDDVILPLVKKDLFSPVGEDTNPQVKEERPYSNDSGCSSNPDTLSAHNDESVAAYPYNLDRPGSQFALQVEFIGPAPQSSSSSLVIDPASPEREEEASAFDGDFCLEVDPDVARSFLGSQYSEASRSSSPNGNRLSPSDLLSMDSARELLWNLDENKELKPVKTWAELGREYLAKNLTLISRISEDECEVTNEHSEYSASRGDKIPPRNSSSASISIEHVEDVNNFGKDRSVREKFARGGRIPEIPRMDSSGPPELPAVKDSLRCELSMIPFPIEELREKATLQSCISCTSYIEADWAQERPYPTSSPIASSQFEAEKKDRKEVTETCSESKHAQGAMESYFQSINAKARTLEITGPQRQCQDNEPSSDEKKIGSEGSGQPMDYRRSSVLSLASGFRFTEFTEQMAGEEECQEGKEIPNRHAFEESPEHTDWRRSSFISLASGFRFTDYRDQMAGEDGCHAGSEITDYPSSSTNSTSTSSSPRLKAKSGLSILASNDDLKSDSNGDSQKVKCDQMKEEPGFDDLASGNSSLTDLTYFPIASHQKCSFPWEDAADDLNKQVVGEAASQTSAVKQESRRVGALIDLFQARGLMQSIKPALHRKRSPASFLHRSVGHPATPTARIITPSGGLYHPAGTVCVAVGHPLSTSPIKRVPTPRSPIVRPSSSLSSVDIDVNSMYGEILEGSGKHSEDDEETCLNDETLSMTE